MTLQSVFPQVEAKVLGFCATASEVVGEGEAEAEVAAEGCPRKL